MEESMGPLDLCLPKPTGSAPIDGAVSAPLDLCLAGNPLHPLSLKAEAVSGMSERHSDELNVYQKVRSTIASENVSKSTTVHEKDVPYTLQNGFDASVFMKFLHDPTYNIQKLGHQLYFPTHQYDLSSMNGKENSQHVEKTDNTRHFSSELKSLHTNHSNSQLCLVCGGKFPTVDSLLLHMKDHMDVLECKDCGSWFSNEMKLRKHLKKNCHSSSWRCSVCSSRFSNFRDFDAHKKIHSGSLLITSGSLYGQNNHNPFMLGRSREDNLYDKLLSGEGRVLHLGSPYLYSDISGSNSEGKFKCDDCGKTFARGRNVQIHRNYGRCPVRRDAKTIFACSDCGKKFCAEKDLIEHKVEHFSDDGKGFPCRDCGKVFLRKTALHIHSGSRRCTGVQKEERSNNHCPECGIVFKFRAHLVEHMVKHTGERAFQCNGCGKWFARARNVKMHVQRGSCVGYLGRKVSIASVHNPTNI